VAYKLRSTKMVSFLAVSITQLRQKVISFTDLGISVTIYRSLHLNHE